MKFNVEKFKQSSRPMSQLEREEIETRKENRDWLAISAKFALSVRHILRTENISQTELASRMEVSPAQVTKILSGKENLSLQTLAKVERALGRSILSFQSETSSIVVPEVEPHMFCFSRMFVPSDNFVKIDVVCDNVSEEESNHNLMIPWMS